MKRLIINADDFGLTAGINRSVIGLHRNGRLTSATLMAGASCSEQARASAIESGALGVGCHVVLVDGEPILPASSVTTLVDPATGRFRRSLGAFASDLYLGRIRAGEIQAEAEAQIGHLQSLGVILTHVDTHKHTHMFPRVLEPLMRAAKTKGIAAIRNPFEPPWSRAATTNAPVGRRMQVQLLALLEPRFKRLLARHNMISTDGAVGVLATGTLDRLTLASLLQAMPEGTWELVTHPGENDAALAQAGTRLLASRELEYQALMGVSFPTDIELIHFGQLL